MWHRVKGERRDLESCYTRIQTIRNKDDVGEGMVIRVLNYGKLCDEEHDFIIYSRWPQMLDLGPEERIWLKVSQI
jgi:hypothetical protein